MSKTNKYNLIIFLMLLIGIILFLIWSGRSTSTKVDKINLEYPVLEDAANLKEIVQRLHFYPPEVRTTRDGLIVVTSKQKLRLYTKPLFGAPPIRDVVNVGDSLIRNSYNDTLLVKKRHRTQVLSYYIVPTSKGDE